jgi:hypothetical protein
MSTLSTTNLKNASSASSNIVLNSDGTIGGAALASASDVAGVRTTGTVTSGTTSLTVASATGISAGMFVAGEGITPGTTVSSIASTTVTLSANAGVTLSSKPVTFYSASKVLTPGVVGGQLCRAWVNFDGTGTVSIRASYSVSSITDNGASDYTVNFTAAFADANYCYALSKDTAASDGPNSTYNSVLTAATILNSSLRVRSVYSNGTIGNDPAQLCVAIFR